MLACSLAPSAPPSLRARNEAEVAHVTGKSMGLCRRGWLCLAAPGSAAAARWGSWRAWRCLHGNRLGLGGGQREKSTDPFAGGRRHHQEQERQEEWRRRNRTVLTYLAAGVVGMAGLSYAAVPLYRLYCQATGLGGSAVAGHGSGQIENMEPIKDRIIKVTFNADVHASLQWNFRPQQTEVYVVPGETALAFYKAKNPTDRPVIGISTYNVVPFEAGQYFNKIQCFCFEEQRLNPHEEVDMPVFFFIDPEFAEDPRMANVDLITLSYTFFEAKEGQKLPLPGYN